MSEKSYFSLEKKYYKANTISSGQSAERGDFFPHFWQVIVIFLQISASLCKNSLMTPLYVQI